MQTSVCFLHILCTRFCNIFSMNVFFLPSKCLRPYHVEHTSSRQITEVKQHRAKLVLGWVTAWEYLVLQAKSFSIYLYDFLLEQVNTWCCRPNLFQYICTIFCWNRFFFPTINVYGHTMLNTPVLVRSLKLSNIGLSQYLDG